MAFFKLAIVLAVCAAASAQYYQQQQGHAVVAAAGLGHEEYYAEPHYDFGYAVKDEHTKDIKQHKESRKGDHTEGEYSFLEADGTTRTVKYHVDGKSGFIAEVIRSGHAVHAPAPVKYVASAPVHYVAPAPVKYYAPAPVKYYAPAPVKYVAPVAVKYVAPVVKYAAPAASSYQTFSQGHGQQAQQGGAYNRGY